MTGPLARVALLSALAALAVPASAGVEADLRVLGFSPDGRYFAFEDSGGYDGANGSWSKIRLIDADADGLALPAFVTEHPEPGGEAPEVPVEQTRAENLRKAAPAARRLGIRFDDPGTAPTLGLLDAEGASGRFDLPGGSYEVRLSTKEFPMPDCLRNGRATAGFALVLSDGRGGRSLHDDLRVPRGRGRKGCVVGYRLRQVRVKGGRLVVFLDVRQPGDFEGESVEHLAVAARLR